MNIGFMMSWRLAMKLALLGADLVGRAEYFDYRDEQLRLHRLS